MSLGTPRKPPKVLGLFAAGLMVATALTATVTIFPSTPVQAQQQLQAQAIDPTRGFADLVDRVMPAVVSVEVHFTNAAATEGADTGQQSMPDIPEDSPFRDFFRQFPQFRQGMPDQQQRPQEGMAQGSGFIISADGYAVTNNHVVKDADQVSVKMKDGTQAHANYNNMEPIFWIGIGAGAIMLVIFLMGFEGAMITPVLIGAALAVGLVFLRKHKASAKADYDHDSAPR